jgi:riboflavin synthase
MMFTGIVTELGTVTSVLQGNGTTRVTIEAPRSSAGIIVGDSISINGVCLTAIEIGADSFSVEIVDESLSRSTLGTLRTGAVVNLERPMTASGRFDGHIVQGHVDGVGTVTSISEEGDAARYRIRIPKELARYTVEKGSIAIDGTSLTITAVSEQVSETPWLEVVLIPHTLAVTVLGRATAGSAVNLETDLIAKYVDRMVGDRR